MELKAPEGPAPFNDMVLVLEHAACGSLLDKLNSHGGKLPESQAVLQVRD